MPVASVKSRCQVGFSSQQVIVEVDVRKGMAAFSIVGLAQTAVKESKHRVYAAINNSGFVFPSRRIIVNLAPCDVPKQGGRFDLAIAIGILVASGQIDGSRLPWYEILGELGLEGDVRAIDCSLAMVVEAAREQSPLILPQANADDVAYFHLEKPGLLVKHLAQLAAFFKGEEPLPTWQVRAQASYACPLPNLAEVRGQLLAKRALVIAAAGGHHMLMQGPPGAGKSMMAERLIGLLPPLLDHERQEVAMIASFGGKPFSGHRPMRSPHHSSSLVSLVGGGAKSMPGEVTLAHRGVLFLDELPHFSYQAINALREPLEKGHIDIARAHYRVCYPCQFQLIAAMNPCPCGYLGHATRSCQCGHEQIERYQQRISGPILDRIDLHINLQPVDLTIFSQQASWDETYDTTQLGPRIAACRQRQFDRQDKLNRDLSSADIQLYWDVPNKAMEWLIQACHRSHISARGFHRVLKLACSIADWQLESTLCLSHIQEAFFFRQRLNRSD